MPTAESLLKEAKSLNKAGEYQKVIDLFTEDILNNHHEQSLKIEKAIAYIHIGNNHQENKDFVAAEEAFQKALKLAPSISTIHFYLGNLNKALNNETEAIDYYNRAIEINPKIASYYNNLGDLHFKRKDYEQAKSLFEKALALNSKDPTYNTNLATVYSRLGESEKALEYLNVAIKADDKFVNAYNGLGSVYYNLGDHLKGIDFLNKGLKINPNYSQLYYNRALNFKKTESYAKALEDFKKYLALKSNKVDYYTSIAKSNIIELKKQIKNSEYRSISEIVKKVKTLLLFNGVYVTHYTSLSVSKILILNSNSKFRLSEGAYLNDTAEGRELFNFLPPCYLADVKANDTIAKPFAPKPFIGSFVADTKHDDLTLWRMYGKEEKDEAKGCAITIEREKLLENISNSLIPDEDNTASEKITE
jgi:tetratricopeptide (TPR) repeat protein